jgi:hypothetical protein
VVSNHVKAELDHQCQGDISHYDGMYLSSSCEDVTHLFSSCIDTIQSVSTFFDFVEGRAQSSAL